MSTSAAKKTTAKGWRRYRFTDEEFDRLIREGILRDGSRAFLWNGEIIRPLAEDQPHLSLVANLFLLLATRFPVADWTVNLNQPVKLREGYRPEPDLIVLRGPRPGWTVRGHLPAPKDVALIVEVSDSTYADDTSTKLAVYARAGIAPYWIVDVKGLCVEVHTLPIPGRASYGHRIAYAADQVVPVTLGIVGEGAAFDPIPVREILAGLIA